MIPAERNPTRSELLQATLTKLRNKIQSPEARQLRHRRQAEMPQWYGAGVIVTNDFASQDDSRKLLVRTHHAEALTWLIFELQDAFSHWVSGNNKHGFYGRLADAALKHLAAHVPEAEDPRPLLIAVLDAAVRLSQIVSRRERLPLDSTEVFHSVDEEGRHTRFDLRTGKETF